MCIRDRFGMRGEDARVFGVECVNGTRFGHEQAARADRFGIMPERIKIRVVYRNTGRAQHRGTRSRDRQRGRFLGQAKGEMCIRDR